MCKLQEFCIENYKKLVEVQIFFMFVFITSWQPLIILYRLFVVPDYFVHNANTTTTLIFSCRATKNIKYENVN